MDRRTTITAILIALSPVACAGRSAEPAVVVAETPAADEASGHAVADAHAIPDVPTEDLPSTALLARAHEVMVTETVVDPSGGAALTLDAEGGVRLWPDVRNDEDPKAFEIPVSEPVWMSLAQTEDGWIAAFIDTVGGGVVGKIELADGGATWTELYVHPATEPLFELHVLDGGARLLALRVDHRLQLWTPRGDTVATLDQAGFVPWQLRVTQPDGEVPHVVAVLAGPTRVQPIAVGDDSLQITGEPRTVALDRGPNRNDLTLSRDGKVVTALRRPKARSKRYELEIIDVASGERKIVAAESDTRGRPRVHPLSSTRALVETGSGQGFYLDYAVGTPWPPAEGEADRETIENTPLTGFAMTHAADTERWHSVIVDGTRFVPTPDGLAIAPLDEGSPFEIVRRELKPTAIGLDDDGDRLLVATPEGVAQWAVGEDTTPEPIPGTARDAALVAFVGDDGLVTIASNGRAALHRLADGQPLANAKIDFKWGIAHSAWRPADEAGFVVLSSTQPSEPAHVLEVGSSGFGATTDVARAERWTWPEGGKPRGAESSEWIAKLGLDFGALGLRKTEVTLTEPDPKGSLVMVGQKIADRGHWEDDKWVDESGNFIVVMVDRDTNEKLWSRPALGLDDTAWSANGKRFAYAADDGLTVVDARTGRALMHRTDRGLTIRHSESTP